MCVWNHCCLPVRGQWRSVSCRSLLHPPQLPGIWSRLVPVVAGGTHPVLPCCRWTKGKPHREWRTLEDSVWISHCQLRHFPGGWCGTIHPRGHCSALYHPYCRPCPQLEWRQLSTVRAASKLLILWPHAACVALGLGSTRGPTETGAMLTRLEHWHYRNIHVSNMR